MYCKYCGSIIDSNTTKCLSCGANIDLNDGGQSFFEDNELSAWQNDSLSYNAMSSVPKTEMREPLSEKSEFSEEYKNVLAKPKERGGERGSYSHRRTKKKKNIWEYLNISSSNKLIIFCIASALAIVLLVVAIIAVLNSSGDNTDENTTQNNLRYNQQVDSNVEQNDLQKPDVDSLSTKTIEENSQEKNVVKDMTEVKDIKILDRDKKEITHSVSAFIDENNTLYVSLDKVLKHEGYKNGRSNGVDSNRIIYEHTTSGKIIEIEKGTKKIWIAEAGESPETKYLDGENFNVDDNTYVPIKSFLVELGYDKDKIKWNKEEKTLYFSE